MVDDVTNNSGGDEDDHDIEKIIITTPAEPVDCEVGPWEIGTCEDGERVDTRVVITQPSNGGAACPVLTRTRTCAIDTDCEVGPWIA